jgi:hypothetical protein
LASLVAAIELARAAQGGALRKDIGLDMITQSLEAEIDAQCEPKQPAMSAAEQSKRAAELAANLLELERQEETLIDIAASEGLDVMRRENASPGAVLGIVVAVKQRAAQAA